MKLVLLALLALPLAGCDSQRRDVCSPVLSEAAAKSAYLDKIADKPWEQQASSRRKYMDFCVQKWGYILGAANSVDPNTVQAVLGACSDALEQLNVAEGMDNEDRAAKHQPVPENFSETSGARVTAEQDNYEHYQRQAYFYLAQAHAGRCNVPK